MQVENEQKKENNDNTSAVQKLIYFHENKHLYAFPITNFFRKLNTILKISGNH